MLGNVRLMKSNETAHSFTVTSSQITVALAGCFWGSFLIRAFAAEGWTEVEASQLSFFFSPDRKAASTLWDGPSQLALRQAESHQSHKGAHLTDEIKGPGRSSGDPG